MLKLRNAFTRTRSCTLGLFAFAVTFALAADKMSAAQLSLQLEFQKTTFRIGEKMRFRIVYMNTSSHLLRILPNGDAFPVDAVTINSPKTKPRPEKIRLGSDSTDFRALSKDAVTLKPRASVTRNFDVDVTQQLPDYYRDSRRGLFLVFDASAIRLPGAGQYHIVGRFHSSQQHPINQYLKGQKLWNGDVESPPVVVVFQE